MTSLRNILSAKKKQKFATDAGTKMHSKMQRIIISDDTQRGDSELIDKIKSTPGLVQFFGTDARTEAPVAGNVNGKFISRRIDRLIKNDLNKTILILDYKTDLDKNTFRDKYIHQMHEYSELLRDANPGFTIHSFILWLNDFTVEEL